MNEEMVQNAMQIILHAGDARTRVEKALIAVSIFDFETAEKEMELAQVKITEAHKVQTDAIQDEIRGTASESSLLFTHAQDTLMTIYSEINIAKQLINIAKSLDQRLKVLEK
ncbi:MULTISPECIES: PTS lactose/cellobiose transporter subunit IIA [Tissierellales]|jgi:PTS system cellobiose-specific IIA component|uniref:PTS lactose/cellobiose transporter subunit IIA n=1 Tax=Acidilutibacter cellobiosedens TaxID=2507161 RepID=A0A410Q930_9FIRM|nr:MULTISPECIES: PTS lactose/cellobiose transporter subunit IIA [Tissierellales]MBE6083304.1 PTS lactose/cellobiose transporter subunit IIA [Tissierellaceae bacterium]QAT60471.1 PTS lactose/cellobiose transporter subunit IIA [Acidilutibacter cellobiosedens]SCL88371.1 Lichenan-specific phosphotransferase enzyme IIA component [Sporanaerobacter sp. PP17-6a]